MNLHEDTLKGSWNQISGELQREWGQLTGSDISQIDGEAKALYGVLQEKYGLTIEEARDKVDAIVDKYDDLSLTGEWNQVKGKVQEWWGELTEDDVDKTRGRRSELVGLVEKKYGENRAEAWRKVNKMLSEL